MKCQECRHFDDSRIQSKESECGNCRAHTPLIVADVLGSKYCAVFPPVQPNDWCGEWRAKRSTPRDPSVIITDVPDLDFAILMRAYWQDVHIPYRPHSLRLHPAWSSLIDANYSYLMPLGLAISFDSHEPNFTWGDIR